MNNIAAITKMFNEKTAELLAQGYSLYLDSMCSPQGEIGKVAFTKNNRYFMLVAHAVKYSIDGPATCVVEFGEAAENFRPGSPFWISDLRNSEKTTFYAMGDDRRCYFTADKAEAEEAYKKNLARLETRCDSNEALHNSEKAIAVCFKITRKTNGYKTMPKKDILGYQVENWYGHITYVIKLAHRPNIRLQLTK